VIVLCLLLITEAERNTLAGLALALWIGFVIGFMLGRTGRP
jgi:hypothetical protein